MAITMQTRHKKYAAIDLDEITMPDRFAKAQARAREIVAAYHAEHDPMQHYQE